MKEKEDGIVQEIIIGILLFIIIALVLNTLALYDVLFTQSIIPVISLLVTALASIAAAISANAASKSATLSEKIMSQDRKKFIESKRPKFIVIPKAYSIKFDTFIEEPVHEINWHDNYERLTDEYYKKEAFIEIANVGNGFAKDINISWTLNDFKDVVNDYVEVLTKNKYRGPLQHKRYDNISVDFGSYILNGEELFYVQYNNNFCSGLDDINYQNLKSVNFVVADIYPKTLEIQLPIAMITFINLVFSDRSWANFFKKSPEMRMKISYKDINDLSYEEIFNLNFIEVKQLFTNNNLDEGRFIIQGNKI